MPETKPKPTKPPGDLTPGEYAVRGWLCACGWRRRKGDDPRVLHHPRLEHVWHLQDAGQLQREADDGDTTAMRLLGES